MFSIKNAYYRTFQSIFNIAARILPWRKATIVKGIDQIPSLLTRSSLKRPMVVTDAGLMQAGITQKVMAVVGDSGFEYQAYTGVTSNPTVNTVNDIYSRFLQTKCDCFIAVGGGSVIDATKGAAARLARPRKSVQQLGGLLKIMKKVVPIIAVPTTAGTGSETTIAALVTDTDTHHKYAIMDLSLIPRYAVLDAELTVGLPKSITAATGMDALTHAVEAYLCWTYNTKESLNFAEQATKLIFENLPLVYEDGTNLDARDKMLEASYMAGFAFTRAGVGNIHAIAHTLGGLYNTPHGLANAVILPIVLSDYGESVFEKLARLANFAGISGETQQQKALAFIEAIQKLNRDMQIDTGFDFIKEEDIPQMIRWAAKEANPLYPVPVIYNTERFKNVIAKIRKQ
ncbi:MAG: iron-containing alcohol dehydrogenase [Oscillospiraceae bacterium]|nr:iron-containing alcohol dehydrogenase [Oscillospiraceae bacterium]